MKNYDAKCKKEVEELPKAAIGWLLMASWLYYHKPNMTPLLSDNYFDSLCKQTLKDFDKLEHKYKHLIIEDDLKAGSLYSLGSHNYPRMLGLIAENLSEKL